ncbi:hypothetical protein [Runella sp.]|uniref:hypothetical protein n=1 Tax=Runella sp. TaxID=1960881 RepID=UPI003018B4DC
MNLGRERQTVRELSNQPRYNSYRNLTKQESGQTFVSGFPKDDSRHKKLKVPYGFVDGTFIGFMDDNTPVRLKQEVNNRHSDFPNRVWFSPRLQKH